MALQAAHPLSPLSATPTLVDKKQRLVVIDMLRGIAMLLMALDHAASLAGWDIVAESYEGIRPHLGGWFDVSVGLMTNLASGIFFTLAGVGVSFFEHSRRKQGWSEWQITRFFLIRAGILFVLDQFVNHFGWHSEASFDVLSAMGFALVIIAFIRHLPLRIIALSALVLFIGYPLLVASATIEPSLPFSNIIMILLKYHYGAPFSVEFPALGRLSLVLAGYVCGRLLQEGKISISPRLLWLAAGGLAVWFVLRVLHGYGNFLPYQPDWPLIYFLIENKQPPSITFLIFNLSWAIVLMVGLKHFEKHLVGKWSGALLTLLGQTALFFYVAHLLLLSKIIILLIPESMLPNLVVFRTFLGLGLTLIILIPLCVIYRNLRKKYSILSYL